MVVSKLLPDIFASAISSIRWPLGSSSSPPLYFQSLEELREIRSDPLFSNIPELVEDLFPSSDPEERAFGFISTALILLGNGYTDECHNLVTPLSWPDDIHFAYGPSVYSQTDALAKTYASYTHCLVHRREAFNVGEFGMVGFANANYWGSTAMRSSAIDELPHDELRFEIASLAQSKEFVDSARVQEWCKDHSLVPTKFSEPHYFEPRALHELCATVLRGNQDAVLQAFAERAVELEIRVLLRHSLEKAGFRVDKELVLRHQQSDVMYEEELVTAKTSNCVEVDEGVAMRATKKVSSAHLENFIASGSIVLRQVTDNEADLMSAAAGIVCILMNAPACRSHATRDDSDVLSIFLASTRDSSLSALDLVAKQGYHESASLYFAPCSKDDERAVFKDGLFGSRGETPTTVVQWSKGTIF